MKFAIILLILFALGFWTLFSTQSPQIMNTQTIDERQPTIAKIHKKTVTDSLQNSKAQEQSTDVLSGQEHTHIHQENTTNSHLEKLSPEVKQAVKDKLLHSEPLDIHKDKKGRTILRSNGRFTQMPVAVKNEDGSVTIKEYSHIPDSK